MAELHRRRKNAKLCAAVADFHRPSPPTFLNGEPVAMMTRALHSADFEFERFLAMSAMARLAPRPLETREDRFDSRNLDKRRRGKLLFRLERNVRALLVMDFEHDGRPMCEIPTVGGLSLADFHSRLLAHRHPAHARLAEEISGWFLPLGRIPPFYLHYLSLGIVHGIIFENFMSDDSEERRFLAERVLPSFARAVEIFGARPLVVRLFSAEEEHDSRIWEYPGELYEVARGLLKGAASEPCISA